MENNNLGKSSLGMEANVAALLSYFLGFITGILFYVLEKENKFVRFHAMQSMLVFGSLLVISLALQLLAFMLWPLIILLNIAGIVLWILLMVKAYQGEYFKLPIVGDIAANNS
ncbi:MAG: DUF4870 domain-containing protein [Candidatus Omnitrophica bacterium]|jgi:uncharacterized membrane protein|nr:DUF4870 domain-containing protein [Candidatus Omnitrophota bacterium]MDD3988163.1 DUF4870 domain-containing protein [Candidatus Omnitrophota bacterium]MDD4981902.1 DUF4870 domain-containing protein [Candidatus Omnitrophota bacterium]MDD5665065.1 DUF4870 domain-containing protein [Candidatus Omnitrophota bacterium]